jgi:hypothetical protein
MPRSRSTRPVDEDSFDPGFVEDPGEFALPEGQTISFATASDLQKGIRFGSSGHGKPFSGIGSEVNRSCPMVQVALKTQGVGGSGFESVGRVR